MNKVVIGYIHPLMIHAPFVQALQQIQYAYHPIEILNASSGPNLSKGRNILVERFLEGDGEYFLMLDTDIVPGIDCVARLVEHELPVVSGMYMQPDDHGGEPYPCMYRAIEDWQTGVVSTVRKYPAGALIEVDSVGAGMLMVRRDVLGDIRQMTGKAAPWFQEVQVGDFLVGEDFTFCMRVKRAGYAVMVDTSVKAGHIKPCMVGEIG